MNDMKDDTEKLVKEAEPLHMKSVELWKRAEAAGLSGLAYEFECIAVQFECVFMFHGEYTAWSNEAGLIWILLQDVKQMAHDRGLENQPDWDKVFSTLNELMPTMGETQ